MSNIWVFNYDLGDLNKRLMVHYTELSAIQILPCYVSNTWSSLSQHLLLCIQNPLFHLLRRCSIDYPTCEIKPSTLGFDNLVLS